MRIDTQAFPVHDDCGHFRALRFAGLTRGVLPAANINFSGVAGISRMS
jgi:hypothetical protein